jgi:hypothetical protein
LLLEWLGYSGPKEAQKQAFLNLLDRNNISYTLLRYQDPLVEEFLKSNLYRNRNNKQLKKDQLEAQWSNFRN